MDRIGAHTSESVRSDSGRGVPSPNTTEVVELACDLIRLESHRDAPGRESAVGCFLADWLSDRGLPTEYQKVTGERANVIARLVGGGGPSLLLNGHLDTVPAGGMDRAFEPRIEGDRLVGRGACDMKGALAAMAGAIAAIRRSAVQLSGDLTLAATVDEESGSAGVGKLVESGPIADYAVVGEPTGLQIGVAHKGVAFVRVTLRGRAAHGSRPDQGVNAAVHAARLVVELEDRLAVDLAARTHALLGESTLCIGRLCGGSQPNIVADRCVIEVDRRTLPGEGDATAELEAAVAAYCSGVAGLDHDVEELPESALVPHLPLETDAGGTLVHAVRTAASRVGVTSAPIGLTYWTDGAALSAAGAQTVVIGPGDIARAHGPDEWAPVREIVAASRMYAEIAYLLLSVEGGR